MQWFSLQNLVFREKPSGTEPVVALPRSGYHHPCSSNSESTTSCQLYHSLWNHGLQWLCFRDGSQPLRKRASDLSQPTLPHAISSLHDWSTSPQPPTWLPHLSAPSWEVRGSILPLQWAHCPTGELYAWPVPFLWPTGSYTVPLSTELHVHPEPLNQNYFVHFNFKNLRILIPRLFQTLTLV